LRRQELLQVASTDGSCSSANDRAGSGRCSARRARDLQAGEIRLVATAGIGSLDALEIGAAAAGCDQQAQSEPSLVQSDGGGDLAFDLVDNTDRTVNLAWSPALTDGNDHGRLRSTERRRCRQPYRDGIGSNNPLESAGGVSMP
jgi:hypothetical protein